MSQINRFVFLIVALVFSYQTHAAPLSGNATMVELLETIPIDGDIDLSLNTMSVSDWNLLFQPMRTIDVELLEPGSYTRIAGDVTVPLDHVGAHMELNWNGNAIYTYMVWNVTNGGATYTIIDSDGDGVPGYALTNGPFPGFSLFYEFETTPTGPVDPNVNLILNVDGGTIQECTGEEGANVTINAMLGLVGGAVLDSISWTINGEDAGAGLSITEPLPLGDHVIEATALTTTGQSDVESVTVTVSDTTRPVVTVAFLDNHGNEVTSSRRGRFEISIEATDICDPAPVITSSSATPTTTVSDGDRLFINPKRGIRLPVTAVRVTVTAKDESGNFSLTTSESSKTITLE